MESCIYKALIRTRNSIQIKTELSNRSHFTPEAGIWIKMPAQASARNLMISGNNKCSDTWDMANWKQVESLGLQRWTAQSYLKEKCNKNEKSEFQR